MPCGFKDKRRQGHRCAQCRDHHRKCDGVRPCRHCKSRDLKCEESIAPPPAFGMVAYRPPAPKQSIGRVLGDDSWLYVRIFFDAVKSSSSFPMAVFGWEDIGPSIHEKGSVFDATTTVGATYAKNFTNHRFSSLQLTDLRQRCFKLRREIAEEICQPCTLHDPTFLIRAQLLSLIELMTDHEGWRWEKLTDQLRAYVSRPPIGVNKSLLRSVKFSIVFHDLTSRGQLLEEDLAQNPCDEPLTFGPQLQGLRSQEEQIDNLVGILEHWVRLKQRSMKWIIALEKEDQVDIFPESPSQWTCSNGQQPSQATLEGLEIISRACALQQEIISNILICSPNDSTVINHDNDFIQPFYHWILTGLCQLFSNPAWRTFDWNLPVMEASLICGQALKALEGAEKMAEKAQLDSIFYAAISPIVGIEMTSPEDRERIIKFVRSVKAKGYAVANGFEIDLRDTWSDPQAYPTWS